LSGIETSNAWGRKDREIIANRVYSQKLAELGYSISTEESVKKFTGINDKTAREIILKESN
jgi:hypothetical protein